MTIKEQYENIITRKGHTVVWRQRNITLDTAHGDPQSETTPTDADITVIFYPLTIEELNSEFFEMGDMSFLTASSNNVLVDDWIFDKAEDEDGFATITGSSASQVVVSGDQRGVFRVDDYISIDDSGNDGLYLVTAVSFSSPNTTVTVTFDADPGDSGDTVYKSKVWYVKKNQDWPSNADVQVRECHVRLRDQYKSA